MATKKKAAKKKAKAPTQEQMMALWMKASTPAKQHQWLEPMAGSFTTKGTFVMDPSMPAEINEGVSEHRLVLGGRFLEQHYRGGSMGMPFEGIGYTGYDNVQKCYVGTWMDTFGTGVMHSVGTGRPSAKGMDFDAVALEPTGKKRKFVMKVRIRDADHHTFDMWTKDAKGKLFRTMRIEYTRKPA